MRCGKEEEGKQRRHDMIGKTPRETSIMRTHLLRPGTIPLRTSTQNRTDAVENNI